jgi:hypothetical protein
MEHVKTQRRFAKPIGLYIITVFDFVAVGLIPLVTTMFAVRNNERSLPFFVIVISIGLPVLVMAATVWAWVGDNVARYLLLALITLLSALLIINNVILVSSGEALGDPRNPLRGRYCSRLVLDRNQLVVFQSPARGRILQTELIRERASQIIGTRARVACSQLN